MTKAEFYMLLLGVTVFAGIVGAVTGGVLAYRIEEKKAVAEMDALTRLAANLRGKEQ